MISKKKALKLKWLWETRGRKGEDFHDFLFDLGTEKIISLKEYNNLKKEYNINGIKNKDGFSWFTLGATLAIILYVLILLFLAFTPIVFLGLFILSREPITFFNISMIVFSFIACYFWLFLFLNIWK